MPATRIFRTTLNSLPVRTRSAWNYRCGRAYHVMGFGCSHRLPGVLPSLPHARDQEEVARYLSTADTFYYIGSIFPQFGFSTTGFLNPEAYESQSCFEK